MVNVTVEGVKELLLIVKPAEPTLAKALAVMVADPPVVLAALALKPLMVTEVIVPVAVVLEPLTSETVTGAS